MKKQLLKSPFLPSGDYRLSYRCDVDKIVHSKAYARYADKTQVAYLVCNDHISHRGLHVQLVSHFARGIGTVLNLNIDLIEAIALGHDVGHPPFGHEGEGYLCELSLEYGNGAFAHPLQSCRLFTSIEPLDLGLLVYDGFLCHDGGMCGNKLSPHFGKTWEIHEEEKKAKLKDPEKNIWPGSLEGCLVKICDTMSYIGRDIEDAINLGILKRSDIPSSILGTTNSEMLHSFATDLITHSYKEEYICISEEVYEALRMLRKFNFQHIYQYPKLKTESTRIRRSYRLLFEFLLNDFDLHKKKSYLWINFLHNKPDFYLSSSSPVQMVVDYISGMTDCYFIRTIENLFIPNLISLKADSLEVNT